MACEAEMPHQPDTPENIAATVEKLSRQIDENFKTENPEIYIRDFIALLDYTQQLPPGSPIRLEAGKELLFYANQIGLYSQGIELADEMIKSLGENEDDRTTFWKENLNAAKAGFYFELRQYDNARDSYSELRVSIC